MVLIICVSPLGGEHVTVGLCTSLAVGRSYVTVAPLGPVASVVMFLMVPSKKTGWIVSATCRQRWRVRGTVWERITVWQAYTYTKAATHTCALPPASPNPALKAHTTALLLNTWLMDSIHPRCTAS